MVAYITELSSENFDSFIENGYSLVDVWAPWCGPCKMISPIVDEMSSIYQGKLSVGKLNADDNRDLVTNANMDTHSDTTKIQILIQNR